MIPDDVEKIIMTKEDYDRNVEQLLLDKCKAELEVERLNNIINELEKWLDKKEKLTFNSWNKGIHEVQRKLQELKEGEKSEKN